MNETWKPIPSFSRYEASSLGNLRTVGRYHRSKPVAPQKHSCGYQQVTLVNDLGRPQRCYVHRLVASAFLGALPAGLDVDHVNGVRTDNRIENLQYLTRKENLGKRIHPNAAKTECKRGHDFATNSVVLHGSRVCFICQPWAAPKSKVACRSCGNEFLPRRRDSIYCGKRCKVASSSRRAYARKRAGRLNAR